MLWVLMYQLCIENAREFDIPTDLKIKYVPPTPPDIQAKISASISASMMDETKDDTKTQWDDKLIGAQSENIPPSKLYVVGPNLPPNTKAMPMPAGNPAFRSPYYRR